MRNIYTYICMVLVSMAIMSCEKENPFEDNIGEGENIGDFKLLTPGNFASLMLNEAQQNKELEITWEAAPTGLNGTATYTFLLDEEGGDFSSPLIVLPSDNEGLANSITVTYGQLISALSSVSVNDFIWTVEARTETDLGVNTKMAENGFEVNIVVADDGVSEYQYTAPEKNEKITVNNSLTPDEEIVFDWEDASSASGDAVNFTIQFDEPDGDFSEPIFESLSDNNGTDSQFTITHQEMSDVLGSFEFVDGLDWRVVASVNEFDYTPGTQYVRFVLAGECGNFCTIGVIGDATPGGWTNDTDMRLSDPENDKFTWTVTVYLTTGELKFRAGDDWTDNWGGDAFPSGTGVQNGPNIAIPTAGYYTITFDDKTGAYSFAELAATEYTSVGIIGSATPGGWDSDTDLTQDAGNPHIWTGNITLTDGEAKFRANDAWDVNWGETGFPSGYGAAGGPNIPVSAGTYTVWFNDVTGEYMFMSDGAEYSTVGIIGDATPGGWDSDTDLIMNPANPFKFSAVVTMTDGEAKFRADDAWDNNWGATDFSSGIGTKNGPNIPITAGTYVISFNSGTGEYRFLR